MAKKPPAPAKASTKTSTVRIDDDLRAEAKAVASKRRITLAAYVEEAIRKHMKND